MMIDQSLILGMQKMFGVEGLSISSIKNHLQDLMHSEETSALCQKPSFLYELAKINSEAAFILWQKQQQQKLLKWCEKYTTEKNIYLSVTKLVPDLSLEKIIFLRDGKGHVLESNNSRISVVEKPLAFRSLPWIEIQEVPTQTFSYSQLELDHLLDEEVLAAAAIVAGAKYKSYKIAVDYSAERSQGGRVIKHWSSIERILSELYLSIKADEVLLKDLGLPGAFLILKDADQFVGQNMQVLGGAGYTEDYVVERLYRECIFLKNWPRPYRQELMNHYQTRAGE